LFATLRGSRRCQLLHGLIERLATVVGQGCFAQSAQAVGRIGQLLQARQSGHDFFKMTPAPCMGVAITFDQLLSAQHLQGQVRVAR